MYVGPAGRVPQDVKKRWRDVPELAELRNAEVLHHPATTTAATTTAAAAKLTIASIPRAASPAASSTPATAANPPASDVTNATAKPHRLATNATNLLPAIPPPATKHEPQLNILRAVLASNGTHSNKTATFQPPARESSRRSAASSLSTHASGKNMSAAGSSTLRIRNASSSSSAGPAPRLVLDKANLEPD